MKEKEISIKALDNIFKSNTQLNIIALPSAAQEDSMFEHDTVENSLKPSETLTACSSKAHF